MYGLDNVEDADSLSGIACGNDIRRRLVELVDTANNDANRGLMSMEEHAEMMIAKTAGIGGLASIRVVEKLVERCVEQKREPCLKVVDTMHAVLEKFIAAVAENTLDAYPNLKVVQYSANYTLVQNDQKVSFLNQTRIRR